MEINCTKHTVTAEETVFSASCDIETGGTVNLPSGKESAKVLKCSLSASVTSSSISDRSVTLEGPVTFSLICLDSENRLFSVVKTVTFSKTLDSDSDLNKCAAVFSIEDERGSASVKEGGRVELNGSFTASVGLKRTKQENIICDIDGRGIEQLCTTAGITERVGAGEKNLILEEEISVGNGQPSVDSVIRSRADSVIDEAKIVGNKVMIKGTLKLYVLYLPMEGTRPQSFEESYPFSQLIEVDGITDDCKVYATSRAVFCELTPRPDIDGDLRSFTANLKLTVSAIARCDGDIPAVTDAFSTEGQLVLTSKEVEFSRITESVNERFIARKELEFSDGDIGSVIDMWSECRSASCRFEEGVFKIAGTIVVALLAYDCEGVPAFHERPIDFEYTRPVASSEDRLFADFKVTVMNCSYTIIGANTISVAVEPTVEASVCEARRLNLISEAVLSEEKNPAAQKSSIILYFADAGESIWDIARRYNSSIAEIKELNGVSDDILPEAKKFLIPTK